MVDVDNNRIQWFDYRGRYLGTKGSKGTAEGQFDRPAGIAVDQTNGWIYVVDSGNNRVQRFDSRLRFMNGGLGTLREWGPRREDIPQ